MILPDLPLSIWIYGIIGAIFIGFGKGGVPGMGNITVAMYALVLPDPKLSVGVLLPILSAADFFAVAIYRKHGQWIHLKRLLPWAFVGLVIGFAFFQSIDPSYFRVLLGIILTTFVLIHVGRKYAQPILNDTEASSSLRLFAAPFLGILGGFATMIANAAGPIAGFYFLAMKLPKYAFIGTIAWFFLIINLVKIPLMVDLGIINWTWLPFSLAMIPFACVATLIAPYIVKHIDQKIFEKLIWFFIGVAALKLLIG